MKDLCDNAIPRPADEIIEKMRLVREETGPDGDVLRKHYELNGQNYICRMLDTTWWFVPKELRRG